MSSALIFLLLLNVVFAAPNLFVPDIEITSPDGNDYTLKSSDNQYELNVYHNTGYLTENVKEIAPGELESKGTIKQTFDKGLHLFVDYTAGQGGYAASYRIWTQNDVGPQHLPANLLKSTAG